MSRVLDLFQVQIGAESTRGTSVTPTARLMGVEEFSVSPVEHSEIHQELRASLQPGFNVSLLRREATADMTMQVSYEDILYLLNGLFSTATATGTTAPYTWSYSAPTTSAAAPTPWTIVYGDGSDGYGIRGALVNELTISAETGGITTAKATFIGTGADTDTTATLSNRSITFVLGHHWSLYIDSAGGTIGTTAIPNTAFSFELTINPNRANVGYLGSLTPEGWRDTRWSGTLKLTVEVTSGTGNTAIAALLDSMLGATSTVQRQIRLKAVSGTNELRIDFAGALLEAPELFSDTDGVVTVELEFAGVYNTNLGNWLAIQVKNGINTLP